MRKCEICGTKYPDDADHCPKCGNQIESTEDTLMFQAIGDSFSDILLEEEKIQEVEPEFINSIGIKFGKIAPGAFIMGSNNWPDTKPVHKVTISKPFFIGLYAVTQKEWEGIIGQAPNRFKGNNRPVECVSWHDCQVFIKKLNEKEKHTKYRLPTEAEWEYCCRASTKTDFYFGNESKNLPEYAWFYENSKSIGTHPVGTKLPNPWGLSDMIGNVWEWCQDWYGPYTSTEAVDPQGESKGNVKVYRGGSWCNDGLLCSAVFRRFNNPNRRKHTLGFRLVMSI